MQVKGLPRSLKKGASLPDLVQAEHEARSHDARSQQHSETGLSSVAPPFESPQQLLRRPSWQQPMKTVSPLQPNQIFHRLRFPDCPQKGVSAVHLEAHSSPYHQYWCPAVLIGFLPIRHLGIKSTKLACGELFLNKCLLLQFLGRVSPTPSHGTAARPDNESAVGSQRSHLSQSRQSRQSHQPSRAGKFLLRTAAFKKDVPPVRMSPMR